MGWYGKESAGLVKRKRPTHQTRTTRRRRIFWQRFGVWVFIVFFAFSVAAGLIFVVLRQQ
jgi:hypothetical protein